MSKYIFAFLIFSCITVNAQPSLDPSWELYFSDEFATFNPNLWLIANNSDHNGEPTVFLTNNVTVQNGKLVLKVDRDYSNYYCPPGAGNSDACGSCINPYHLYTGGWVESNINFQYGYLEASINFPYSYGLSYTFWTYNGRNASTINPPYDANEIDISENYGIFSPNLTTTNIHLCYPTKTNGLVDPAREQLINLPIYSNAYHKYAIEWDPTKIIWYFDDNVIRISENPGVIDPVRLIFQISYDERARPGYYGGSNHQTQFPSYLYVDYVHAYKLKNDCNNSINSCSFNFQNYDNKEKKQITIGGAGCSNTLPVGSSVAFRAATSIDLNGELNIPLGSDFLADVNSDCDNNTNNLNYKCDYMLSSCNYNFTSYSNDIKTWISLGGNTGCTAIVANNQNVSLKALQYITLNPGFRTEYGCTTEAKIVTCQ